MAKEIPKNCPYSNEKGEEPHFTGHCPTQLYCSGYRLPNIICNNCKSFFRNFWKDKYGTEWKPGASRVKHVLGILGKRFPDLTIQPTKYALEEGYIPPSEKHKKHEPDVIVSYKDSVICMIEVTGSNIEMEPPNDIFILRGKYWTAQIRKRDKDKDTWFYTVYRNSEYVLDLDLIKRFDGNKAQCLRLKGVPEWYVLIPCAEAYPNEELFKWVEEKLKAK